MNKNLFLLLLSLSVLTRTSFEPGNRRRSDSESSYDSNSSTDTVVADYMGLTASAHKIAAMLQSNLRMVAQAKVQITHYHYYDRNTNEYLGYLYRPSDTHKNEAEIRKILQDYQCPMTWNVQPQDPHL